MKETSKGKITTTTQSKYFYFIILSQIVTFSMCKNNWNKLKKLNVLLGKSKKVQQIK